MSKIQQYKERAGKCAPPTKRIPKRIGASRHQFMKRRFWKRFRQCEKKYSGEVL